MPPPPIIGGGGIKTNLRAIHRSKALEQNRIRYNIGLQLYTTAMHYRSVLHVLVSVLLFTDLHKHAVTRNKLNKYWI